MSDHHPDCIHRSGAVPESMPCPCGRVAELEARVRELEAGVEVVRHWLLAKISADHYGDEFADMATYIDVLSPAPYSPRSRG